MQGPNVRLFKRRTVPGYAAVRGEADTNAFVTVNERPVARTSEFFHGGNYADNTLSNLYADLEIYAAINPSGTNTPDTVYSITTSVFVAKTPETFTYDSDGNMASDGRFTYTWNADNRLVCASNAEVVVTYAYDYRGRMVRKTIARTGSEPQSIAYTWDDWNIIRETLVTRHSSLVTHNVWGLDLDGTLQGAGGVGGLLAVIVPRPMGEGQGEGGTAYLPCYDANGNITEYVSTNGEVVAHYDYSPFGDQLVVSGPLADSFTHRFSTKPYCPVTGFSEYQMRKYRPDIGRWMSRDPIEDEMNLWILLTNQLIPSSVSRNFIFMQNILDYIFIGNTPINLLDVIGLLPCGTYPEWGGTPAWPPFRHVPSKGNCWRYACNDPVKNGEPPRVNPPGVAVPADLDCEKIMNNVLKIGGTTPDDKTSDCPDCHYKVLLVIMPGIDAHWYRQDDNGSWSHKPGDQSVIIGVTDPESDAKMRKYTEICGYLCMPNSGTDVDRW